MDSAPKLPPKPVREQAKVLYAYEAQNEDELTIKEGDIINVISKEIEDQGWFKGELQGKVGVFPDNFVELIKVPLTEEEKPLPPRPNKTPPSSAISSLLGKKTSTSDGNPVSNGAKESIPTKTSIFGLKKSSKQQVPPSKTSSCSSTPFNHPKPDVVPLESSSLNESTSSTASVDPVQPVSGVEGLGASASKLNHLTANRAKGPSNRRPPSYISTSNNNNNSSSTNSSPSKEPLGQENGVEKSNGSTTPNLIRAASVTSETSTVKSGGPVTSPGSKGKEDPPWMVELRKTQEAKKGLKTDATPIASSRCIVDASKAKTSPNRTSGDFSSRVGQFNGQSTAPSESIPVSILKPTKPVKPGIVTSCSPSPANTSNITSNNTSNNNSLPSANSLTCKATEGTSSSKLDSSSSSLIELQKELKLLRETMVPRKDFDDLTKQVVELRDLLEVQKAAQGTLVKELINDLAEERKKLAMLQIEMDRIRKLTTTV